MPTQDSDFPVGRDKLTSPGGDAAPVDQLTPTQKRNLRIGLWLFTVYAVFYGGFVFVSAFAADWTDWQPIDGLNLAILWGFALILVAFLLAAAYGWMCRGGDNAPASSSQIEERTR